MSHPVEVWGQSHTGRGSSRFKGPACAAGVGVAQEQEQRKWWVKPAAGLPRPSWGGMGWGRGWVVG